ncbi:MAG: CHAT domain-containing protein [Acidobacteriota bacterium]|nr:CHAT domain-containing protein [Acidobacteriota bacterium]
MNRSSSQQPRPRWRQALALCGKTAGVVGVLLIAGWSIPGCLTLERVNPDTITVERYPWLQAPEEVPVGDVFEVTASLEVEPPGMEVANQELQLPDQSQWQLTVILEAPDCEIVGGEAVRTVNMERDKPSEPAVFQLQAIPGEDGWADGKELPIAASFWYENRLLVRVSETMKVGAALKPAELPQEEAEPAAMFWEREEADLQIVVSDRSLILSAPVFGPPIYIETEPLSAEDRQSLEQLYAELEAVAASRNLGPRPEERQAAEDGRARATAVRIGRVLWQRLAPPAFQDAFWDLADGLGNDFDSLQIYADDPSIPWELMRPSREGLDGLEERDFLGLEFDIARGHAPRRRGRFVRMPGEVPLDALWVLRPDYRPPLLGTAAEVQSLQAFQPVSAKIRPSTYDELVQITQELPNGILHFAGHGVESRDDATGTTYSILLSDQPVTLNEWLGLLPAPRLRNHPFIFFNACSVGKTHQSLGFAEGWAPAFLEAGASGYVGTLWPVGDQAAARFAGRFYEALETDLEDGGGSPARAIREARRLFTEDPNPTYLAYVLYGETDLLLTRR